MLRHWAAVFRSDGLAGKAADLEGGKKAKYWSG